ncbi:hypothetical protein M9H77_13207 [Catharanthus roseus]|uniref:Uncharacterized protein n=1 Tax=Catharanthus roseus TaxID=4058 RepID=A0ACC0BJN9_CATRO|nr:hypothetical protein M9H77_13207 [Catharanthus roseus]
MCKVLWRHHGIEEATWETEEFLRRKYPKILGSLMNDMLSSCTLDMDPIDRGRSTVGVRRSSSARVVQGGLVGTPGLVTYFVYQWCMQWFMKSNVRPVCFGFLVGIDYGMSELISKDPI